MIVFHGTADDLVPVAHGRKLAAAAPAGRYIEIAGGEHNEIPMQRLRAELEGLRKIIVASGPRDPE